MYWIQAKKQQQRNKEWMRPRKWKMISLFRDAKKKEMRLNH